MTPEQWAQANVLLNLGVVVYLMRGEQRFATLEEICKSLKEWIAKVETRLHNVETDRNKP